MARASAEDIIRRYEQAKSIRNPHETDWRAASAYCLPRHYQRWSMDGGAHGNSTLPVSNAASRVAYDTTGTRSLKKYMAVLHRLCTPDGQRWATLQPSDPYLRKQYAVRLYFDEVNNLLHSQRYGGRARLVQALAEAYASIGVYGMGPMYVGQRRKTGFDRKSGPVYRALHMVDVFIEVDDEGNVNTVFRRFWLTARQAATKFGAEKLPGSIKLEFEKPGGSNDQTKFEFVHVVLPRNDYDGSSIEVNRFPWEGSYVAVKDKQYVGEEEGFRSMPYLTPRTFTEADEPYGYSPAMEAMPALGGVSAMKKTLIKQGQKAVDPPLLANDDGVLSGRLDIRAGRVNYGGMSADGKRLVAPIEMGNFNVAEKLIQDERQDIEDSFFVTLFQILQQTPEMTATEVMERLAEKASLLSPTMGRLQAELLAPMIDRELDIAAELGLLPEPPPEVVEAGGQFDVAYTSPMAKAVYTESIQGFMRTVDMATQVSQARGDASLLELFDFETALPEIADQLGAPPRWLRDAQQMQQVKEDQADAQESEQLVKAAPALASVATAAMKQGEGTATGNV